jgi:Flp pilus assembly protein TadG
MKVQIDLHRRAMALKHSLSCAAKSNEPQAEPRFMDRRLRALLRSGEQGSALVEIALVLPVLMGLVTALCAFGLAFNNQLTLTSAVGAGGQYLQTIRTDSPANEDPCASALTAIENAAPNLKGSSLNVTVTINGTAETPNSCTGAATAFGTSQGEPVTVAATYPCVLPIMPMGYGTKFVSNCQLSASVTEYEY